MFTHTCTHPHPQLLALHTHANAHTCMNNKMAWMTKMAALTHRYARTHSHWSALTHIHIHFNTHTHMHTHMHARTIYAQQDNNNNNATMCRQYQYLGEITSMWLRVVSLDYWDITWPAITDTWIITCINTCITRCNLMSSHMTDTCLLTTYTDISIYHKRVYG